MLLILSVTVGATSLNLRIRSKFSQLFQLKLIK
jgi:hypothetical protein